MCQHTSSSFCSQFRSFSISTLSLTLMARSLSTTRGYNNTSFATMHSSHKQWLFWVFLDIGRYVVPRHLGSQTFGSLAPNRSRVAGGLMSFRAIFVGSLTSFWTKLVSMPFSEVKISLDAYWNKGPRLLFVVLFMLQRHQNWQALVIIFFANEVSLTSLNFCFIQKQRPLDER